jgi:hypothetical protein
VAPIVIYHDLPRMVKFRANMTLPAGHWPMVEDRQFAEKYVALLDS